MEVYNKEDLEKLKSQYLTVGELKKKLDKYTDDSLVMAQRVEDTYFDNNHWRVYPKIGQFPNHYEQYIPIWCVVKYPDEKDILFLDLHY